MNKKIFLLCFSLLFVHYVQAQDEKCADTTQLWEKNLNGVVIKATKENLKYRQMPAAVTLMSARTLENNEIKSLSQLSALVPNTFMLQYGSKYNSSMYIRGIGSKSGSPSVGLYVDHVPYFEKTAFEFDFFDIDRVEVLRGPQGTLFGRNTMGGIINITTKSPLYYKGATINLSAANYGTYNANLAYYDKACDKFGYSIGVNYLHNDGFFTNEYTGKKADRMNSLGLRNRLAWKLNEQTLLENIANFEFSEQDGYPYSLYDQKLQQKLPVNYNLPSFYNRNMFSDALVGKYLINKVNIISTTAYQFVDDMQDLDQDFTAANLYHVTYDPLQHMISQEITAKSVNSSKINWIAGAYGFYQYKKTKVHADVYNAKSVSETNSKEKIWGGALFGQASVNNLFVEGLKFTAGVRLDNEKYNYDHHSLVVSKGKTVSKLDTLYKALNSNVVTPKVALDYTMDNINFYFSIAKGYKSGGYNISAKTSDNLTYKPEYSWNYEAGTKTSFFDNTLFADLSFFYIDWKNQQITQLVKVDERSQGKMIKNAGHSQSKGFEASIRAFLPHNFNMFFTYGFTQAKYVDYKDKEQDAKDKTKYIEKIYNENYIPYIPAHTLSIQADKMLVLPKNGIVDNIRFHLLYKGMGKIYWDDANTLNQPFYSMVDGKIGFVKSKFELSFWVKNLFNQGYDAYFFSMGPSKYFQTGKPRQFGVNLSIKL